MKKYFFIGSILVFIAEIIMLIVFAVQAPDVSQDAVNVNEIVMTVTRDFERIQEHTGVVGADYVVLDNSGNILYKTRSGLSESVNEAIAHRDTMLDITTDGTVAGKVIIYNNDARSLQYHKRTAVTVLSIAIVVELAVCIGYAVYLHVTVVKPFRKLKDFAERVAGGNLDIPLEMDRRNLFGAFTESFDIMRSELKQARLAEAQAQQSKKELVAKLSHDIKTPVASINAVSEVGIATTKSEKDRANYAQIINKSDQINTLVTNLFTATLEELQQLTVSPTNMESTKIRSLLENADYLHRAVLPDKSDFPSCLVYADRLRLQQVFDNIFANSYKYTNTEISVDVRTNDNAVEIAIEDFGGGVPAEELPMLKEKFKRGSNAKSTEGAGLGLYISDYFMNEMCGGLDIENGENGLRVVVSVMMK